MTCVRVTRPERGTRPEGVEDTGVSFAVYLTQEHPMFLSLDDFEEAARRVLPRPIFGYAFGGSETGASMRANRAVWDDYSFVPKMLVDTSGRSQKTTLFGRSYDLPFGIAPMGGTSMAAF